MRKKVRSKARPVRAIEATTRAAQSNALPHHRRRRAESGAAVDIKGMYPEGGGWLRHGL
jgi:hypothetical protein